MSPTTTTQPPVQQQKTQPAVEPRHSSPSLGAVGQATYWHSIRAEWIKIRTMRSTLFVILGTLAFCAGLAALNGSSAGDDYARMTAGEQASFDPLAISLQGYLVAQIALGLLGALVITSEYGARTIVSTLTSVPHRARVMGAKALVLAGVGVPVGLLVSFTGFVIGQASLAAKDAPYLALSNGLALRGIAGGSVYLGLAALLGLAIGSVIRSTTATVTTLFVVMLIVVAFAPALPGTVGEWVSKYWPTMAGGQIITGYRDPALLGPWAGLSVMAVSVAVLLTAGLIVFSKRDA